MSKLNFKNDAWPRFLFAPDRSAYQTSIIALVLCLALPTTVLMACNIPVFRYALERWEADPTEIVVIHQNALTPKQQEWVSAWQHKTQARGGHVNAKIVTTNDVLELPHISDSQTPHVVLRAAIGQGKQINFWQGNLEEADAFLQVDSPIRNELRRRLLNGHSVVWLLVKTQDTERNAQARKTLEQEFDTLADDLALPEGVGLPGSELFADVPLLLKYSVLEIDEGIPGHDDVYLHTLFTGIRRDEYEQGQPLIVPVFGRGRALEVIPADDLTGGLVRDLTKFLGGACSCQVKEQNPGFDLMMNFDWDEELFGGIENRPPDRSQEEGKNRGPVLVPIAPGR